MSELKNLLERAAWTFAQTAISTFVALEIAMDLESLRAGVITAATAGAAAALSAIKTYAQDRLADES